jgi:GxxExxY protein
MQGFTAENAEGAEKMDVSEPLTRSIIGAAITVHRALGAGLLESAYEACLAAEFDHLGVKYVRQMPLPLKYRGIELDCAYRIDFLVEGRVVLELKSVKQFDPIDQTQLLSYLRLSKKQIGLLINFNVTKLTDGIKRLVHDFNPS